MSKVILIILLSLFWAVCTSADVDTAWVRRYNGPGNSDDFATAIAVDSSGNVYMTGYCHGGNGAGYDYATIRYYPNGDTAWLRTYNGPISSDDNASAITVDGSGNVYVAGKSRDWISYDYATIKYDASGNQLWVQRYNGPGYSHHDEAHAIALDDSGNVYVTGFSDRNPWWDLDPDYDYTTIKYYPNGDTAWLRTDNEPGNFYAHAIAVDGSGDIYVTGTAFLTIKYYPNGDTAWVRRYDGCAYAIAVDDSGNVYVTGKSDVGLRYTDYLTLKYYPNGDTAWVRRYDGPAGNPDAAQDIAVDNSGNVYVTGWSIGIGTYHDYATIKYAPKGDELWVRRYNGGWGDNNDVAHAISVDALGNIYVTGFSRGNATAWDYVTIKYDTDGNELWLHRYNGPGNWLDEAQAIAVDASGNVYVTGESYGPGTYEDYATLKYYSNGDTAWVRRYNGPQNNWDWACDVAVDDSHNVYVTGASYGGGTDRDYVTVKYYPSGDIAWVRTYNGPGNSNDSASAIAVDSSGNVYVTGTCATTPWPADGYSYATVKYYPNGDLAWVRIYSAPYNFPSYAHDIAVDNIGNIYVTGESFGVEPWTYEDYLTIKYYPNGDTAWIRRYNGPLNSPQNHDVAWAIAVDNSCNVYVTGQSHGDTWAERADYATIKYDSSGNEIWVARYDGIGNWDDMAYAITVDDSGNVYVTGESNDLWTGQDYATIKYYPNGDTAWVRRYDGPDDSKDESYAIAVDDFGNVYVTGLSIGSGTGWDYATIKYDSNGTEVWVTRYNGTGNSADAAHAIAIDASGNVYVTGESYGAGLKKDYATIKYDANGNEMWVRIYDGPESESDAACAIAIDNSGSIYVTGGSYGTGTDKDYATIKYVQTGSDIKDETGSREKPVEFTLSQNYPNPFNQTTKIEFTLAKSGFVSLNIYDILGRKVRILVSERLSSGFKSVLWDGKNDSGNDVASGIYFYRIRVEDPASGGVGDFSETKKLVLLK